MSNRVVVPSRYYNHWIQPIARAMHASPRVDTFRSGEFLFADDVDEYLAHEASDALPILPREIPAEELPSTPHLNAIMDRAMKEVKALLYELEMDRGKQRNCVIFPSE